MFLCAYYFNNNDEAVFLITTYIPDEINKAHRYGCLAP